MPFEEPWYVGRYRFLLCMAAAEAGRPWQPRDSELLEQLIRRNWAPFLRRNAARDLRWQLGLAEGRAELEELNEKEACGLGANGSRPADWQAAIWLYYLDCPEHPDDWPPEYRLANGEANGKLERAAADRILTAIRRSQG